MKYLITMVMLLAQSAMAYEVPKDAVIKVFDAKGREIGSMSRKDFKVVKVEEHPPTFSADQVASAYKDGQSAEEQRQKSEIVYSGILTAGVGKDGLDYSHVGVNHVVNQKTAPVGMAQVCATRNKIGLCASAATNQFYGLGLKLDFK